MPQALSAFEHGEERPRHWLCGPAERGMVELGIRWSSAMAFGVCSGRVVIIGSLVRCKRT
jgi:hypothetical protein